ncbi:MAG: D-alanine--D-alanine ligase, partial [Gammaproteobacteria bacterium]|nr:D-alanine--D-alanine ligase [Gammaproteobacteria bacterium]
YINGVSTSIIPAELPEEVTRKIQAFAIEAFLAIDAAGLARVDFFVDRDSFDIYISEINTMPGFTPISMYPKLWEASGIAYAELLDRLIELALERRGKLDQVKFVL